tara:strand:- start:3979 stop:7347 length:3369 start_codon:yes stop_codon:yes gene_type:complete
MLKNTLFIFFICLSPFVASQEFEFVTTDCNMTMVINDPEESNFSLDGDPIPMGAILGVFYTSESDELVCAGTEMWIGETISIAAWGSEAGLDNGFASGEEFTFLLYFEDESGNPQVAPTSTVEMNLAMDNTYACNGLGQIVSLIFSTSCCADVSACNYNESCEINEPSSCEYPESYYDCEGNCLVDTDGDGVCDELEISGCMDDGNQDWSPYPGTGAVNYNENATDDDGSCEYTYYGCTNPAASNYEIEATDDDGTCLFCSDENADNYFAGDDVTFCEEDIIDNYTLELGPDGYADCCFYINLGCTDDGSCFDFDGDGDLDECDDRFLYENEEGESIYYESPFPGTPAANYNPSANTLVGLNYCYYFPACLDVQAMNYGYNCSGDDVLSVAESIGYSIDFNEEPETDAFILTYNGVSFNFEGSNSCCLYYGCDDIDADNYQDIDGVFYQNDELPDNTTNPNLLYELDGTYDILDELDLPPFSNIISMFSPDDIDGDGILNSEEELDPDSDNDYTVYMFGGATDTDSTTPCVYFGCMDTLALNYAGPDNLNEIYPPANTDDNSCIYYTCEDPSALNTYQGDDGYPCEDYFNNQTYLPGPDEKPDCCDYLGCMDETAYNYNPNAQLDEYVFYQTDDGDFLPLPLLSESGDVIVSEMGDTVYQTICYPYIFGCLDDGYQSFSPTCGVQAENFNDYDQDGESNEYIQDSSDIYILENLEMYDATAVFNTHGIYELWNLLGNNTNVNISIPLDDDGIPIWDTDPINSVYPCEYIYGCTCPAYIEYYNVEHHDTEDNFNFSAINSVLTDCFESDSCDFESCDVPCNFDYSYGCTELSLPNTVPTFNDGSCENLLIYGCMDPYALNYNPEATLNDCNSCIAPIEINYDIINPICFDNLDGDLFFEVTGGVSPYTYSIYTNFGDLFLEDGITYSLLSNELNIPPGEYFLEVIDSEGYTSSISFPIVMPDDLTIDIWDSGGWLNTFEGYDVYEWTLDGNILIGENTNQIYPVTSGMYGVTVSFEYEDGTCISNTVYYDYQVFVNTIDDEDSFSITCNPNPFTSESVVNISKNGLNPLVFSLYDSFGKRVWDKDYLINNEKSFIISGLHSGMYYLCVTSIKEVQIIPMIVLN